MLALTHDEHRTASMSNHALGRAAEEHVRQSRVAMRREEDEVDVEFSGGSDDFNVRAANAEHRFRLHLVVKHSLELGQFSFAAFAHPGCNEVPIDCGHFWRGHVWLHDVKQHEACVELFHEGHGVLQCLPGAVGEVHGHEDLF